jgi:hypothetical protein
MSNLRPEQRRKLAAGTHRICEDCGWVLLRVKLTCLGSRWVCARCAEIRRVREVRAGFRILPGPARPSSSPHQTESP